MGKLFDPALIIEYAPLILSRLPVTLLIVFWAIVGGSIIGTF